MRRIAVASAGCLFLLCGCSDDSTGTAPTGDSPGPSPSPNPPPSSRTVDIRDFSFGPASVTLSAGGSVTWRNLGPSVHNVAAEDGSWASGNLGGPGGIYGDATGASFSQIFSTAGTIPYRCTIHPEMTGTITVTE